MRSSAMTWSAEREYEKAIDLLSLSVNLQQGYLATVVGYCWREILSG